MFILFLILKAFSPMGSEALQTTVSNMMLTMLQQIGAIMLKRLFIFVRRYIIAGFFLLTPVLIAIVCAASLDTADNVLNSDTFKLKNPDPVTPLMSMYGKQKFVYKINASDKETIRRSLSEYMKSNGRDSLFDLYDTGVQSINDYVFQKREESYDNLIRNYYGGFEIYMDGDLLKTIGYYSSMVYHSSAAILNEANSFALAYYTGKFNKSIRTVNAPIVTSLNLTDEMQATISQALSCLEFIPFSTVDILTSIVFACLISYIAIHLTREKRNGSKSLQLLSGTHFSTYWVANYLFDMCLLLVSIISFLLIMWIVALMRSNKQTEAYVLTVEDSNFFYMLAFLFISSFSWPLLAYLWSFLFKSDIVSYVVLTIILSLTSFLDMVFVFLQFLNIGLKSDALGHIADALRFSFALIFPNVSIKKAVYNIKIRKNPVCVKFNKILFNTEWDEDTSFLSVKDPGVGKYILFTLGFFLIAWSLLILIEILIRLNWTCMTDSKRNTIYDNLNNQVELQV
jgi:hypothetical protein